MRNGSLNVPSPAHAGLFVLPPLMQDRRHLLVLDVGGHGLGDVFLAGGDADAADAQAVLAEDDDHHADGLMVLRGDRFDDQLLDDVFRYAHDALLGGWRTRASWHEAAGGGKPD